MVTDKVASENAYPGILIRESADDGSDFPNPPADYRRLFVGEDGLFHLKDPAGAVTSGQPAAGAGAIAQAFRVVDNTSRGPTATPAPVTAVPGLATIAFTIAATKWVRVRYGAVLTRQDSGSGRNAYSIKANGSATGFWEVYGWNGGESDLQFVAAEWIVQMTAGTYTIEAEYRASGNTSLSTFTHQHLTVEVFA